MTQQKGPTTQEKTDEMAEASSPWQPTAIAFVEGKTEPELGENAHDRAIRITQYSKMEKVDVIFFFCYFYTDFEKSY